MKLELGFGKTVQIAEIPDQNVLEVLLPAYLPPCPSPEEELRRALREPIGSPPLASIVSPGEKIAVITSDVTRPMPSKTVLPILFEELDRAGIPHSDVTVVFALGSHRPHTEEEKERIVGADLYRSVACVDSTAEGFVRMGVTSSGTPVDIAAPVARADRRICLGNIEYHYFAGYSGGAKAIMPGVSSREAIQQNHRHMIEAGASAGNLNGNPVRSDLEEALRFCPCDFLLNVVLDEHKQIAYAVAGDAIEAHREGCRTLDRMYRRPISQKADLVIVSPGGYPKDINLYQAQKALDNARGAVRNGGIILLLASCAEGLGEKTFEEWLLTMPTPRSMIDRIRTDFQLGGHKAAAIALAMEQAQLYLVSDLSPEFVSRLHFQPFPDLQTAVNQAFEVLGPGLSCLVMPFGQTVLPKAESSSAD